MCACTANHFFDHSLANGFCDNPKTVFPGAVCWDRVPRKGHVLHWTMAWQYFQPPAVISFIEQREQDRREVTTSSTQSITLNSNALPPFSPERRLPQHPGLARYLPAVNGLVGHLAVVDGPLTPAEGLALAPS